MLALNPRPYGKRHIQAAGFTLLELIVVIALVAFLGAVALDRLSVYVEQAEKAAMEYTVASLRSGLRMQVAEFMVEGRMRQLSTLVGSNPMLLMETPLPNYRADAPKAPDAPHSRWDGYWFFDPTNKELVYQVKRGTHFVAGPENLKQVRFHVAMVYSIQAPAGMSVIPTGAKLELVRPYRWFESE